MPELQKLGDQTTTQGTADCFVKCLQYAGKIRDALEAYQNLISPSKETPTVHSAINTMIGVLKKIIALPDPAYMSGNLRDNIAAIDNEIKQDLAGGFDTAYNTFLAQAPMS